MPSAESTVGPAALAALRGISATAVAPGHGIAVAGPEPRPGLRTDALATPGVDLRAELVDTKSVRFGEPTGGKTLTFEVVGPSKSPKGPRREQPTDQPGDHPDDQTHDTDSDLDPALVRAGAAVAARRRELGISQRSLAADGIINAGALIAFEKGRSWPRERTRTKLEEVLQWPRGTIARVRNGAAAVTTGTDYPTSQPTATPVVDSPATATQAAEGPTSLIAQAVAAAVDTCRLAIAALPPPEDPEFIERSAPILADLRQLERIAVQATRISRITPALIKAMSSVRRYHDKLMTLGASAPGATLAQRLYAARRRANLSTLETAQAAGVTEEIIVRAEAEEALPAQTAEAIEALISQLN